VVVASIGALHGVQSRPLGSDTEALQETATGSNQQTPCSQDASRDQAQRRNGIDAILQSFANQTTPMGSRVLCQQAFVRKEERQDRQARAGAVPRNALGRKRVGCGSVSWYSGEVGASGEHLRDRSPYYAASPELPFDSNVRVRYGRAYVTVRILDRGPYVGGRVLDISPGAFRQLAPLSEGVIYACLSL
jgi:rare lipoprotein A (peptidoglycan hydrolase)